MAVERTVEFVTEVMQDSYHTTGEGTTGKLRLNPRGELVVPDFYTQLVLDGRVFNASNAVQETDEAIVETGRGTNNINPSLLLDVPTGTTAIPLEVIIDLGNTPGTSVDMVVTINTDDKVRYSSGGGAITPINMRKDDPRSSACTFKSASTQIVAATNTDDDTIYCQMMEAEATPRTVTTGEPWFCWTARKYTPPVLIGPASFMVFVVADTTNDQELNWSVKWAEFATTDIT